ncbi:MAG: class I tRNA ligase family protein, partial [Burkholderiales bacterium]
REIHATLKQATYDIQRLQFNTVASASMKMLNALAAAPRNAGTAQMLHEGLSILLRTLSPITPHLTQAMWRELGYAGDMIDVSWPEVDASALEQDELELVLQVNGKLRGRITASKDATDDAVRALALAHEAVAKQLAGAAAKRVIVVKGKLVNVVV